MRNDPYKVVPEYRENRSFRLFHAVNIKPIPDDLPSIVGDCVQNFRAALDYLACWLVEENGGRVSDGTGFPIRRSCLDKSGVPQPIRIFGTKGGPTVSSEALVRIEEVQPYNRGKGELFGGERDWLKYLWFLNELARRDRHRSLSTVVAVVRTATSAFAGHLTAPIILFTGGPLKEGEVFATATYVESEAEHHSDPEFRPDVTFNEPTPIGMENVVSVLTLIRLVVNDMVLPRFEPFFLPRYV